MKISAKTVSLGNKKIKLVSLGEVADVKQGLSTGDNSYYVYTGANDDKSYREVDRKLSLVSSELEKIKSNKNLRRKIVNNGISKSMFNSKTIVPYDKGTSSDIEAGRLNNYFSPTKYYINWSEKNLIRLKSFTVADKKKFRKEKNIKKSDEKTLSAVFRNPTFYFKDGITFSLVGLYSPTFRLNSGAIYQDMGSCIFPKSISLKYLLGILCSKFCKYILKCFIINTVASTTDSIKLIPIAIGQKHLETKIEKLVSVIVNKQKKDLNYPYQLNEQIEIDKLVYEIFGLDQELIDEVETWYARRYPKLVRN